MKPTGESILVHWLISKFRQGERISNYSIQREVPDYSSETFGQYYTPSTCEKYFRNVRTHNTLRHHGLKLNEIPKEKRTCQWFQWEVKPLDKVKIL